ncbi:MAG TPA: ATP-grasp domain-containing protein [Sedimentisphaerales bacterium]|nr:ATP-grasp domain-containing protein [Sedimentisphaerales bacterium]
MKVAVVRNRSTDGIINRFGQPCPEVYGKQTVQRVINALEAGGHTVACIEADKSMLAELEKFMPPEADAATGRPGGIVFNMAYGIQGQSRYTHVPAMLEMAGIPYTGACPLGQAVSLDKVITKILVRDAGIPTPRFQVLSRPDQYCEGLRFPLIVKPRHESTSYGLHLVRNDEELQAAVLSVVAQFQQQALVEEYIDGREVCVGLLGNQPAEILPPVELDFGDRPLKTLIWEDKYHKRSDEPWKICPAPLSADLSAAVRSLALDTFQLCHCRDYARVDMRIDVFGKPFVLEINSMASLGPGGSFVRAAHEAGYDFFSLVARILDVAHERYYGVSAPKDTCAAGTTAL